MEIRDSEMSLVFLILYICKMKKNMKEKNQVVPDEVLSKEFISQFKTEADVSRFLKQFKSDLSYDVLQPCNANVQFIISNPLDTFIRKSLYISGIAYPSFFSKSHTSVSVIQGYMTLSQAYSAICGAFPISNAPFFEWETPIWENRINRFSNSFLFMVILFIPDFIAKETVNQWLFTNIRNFLL